MNLKEKINHHLEQIRHLKGVENVVLTQRDGNPIQSVGVWFSREEIFNVSSATSAVFNVAIHLHPKELKYLLLEGKRAKILIAPLNNPLHGSLNGLLLDKKILDPDNEFFIAITAQPNINLGGIFLQTADCLKKIKTTLITSNESFKPPLIQFDNQKIEEIFEGFNIKEEENRDYKLSTFSLNFSSSIAMELNSILKSFSITIPDLAYGFIAIEGGFIASKIFKKAKKNEIKIDNISAMSYSLLETANRCAWLLKKMNIENILIDCKSSFQFINGLDNAIFSAEIGKTGQKLGLLRLILPQFSNKVREIMIQTTQISEQSSFNIENLLGELIIK